MSSQDVDESTDIANHSVHDEGYPQERVKSKEMSIFDHLEELRRRIIYSVLAIMIAFIFAFVFNNFIFEFIIRPYGPDFHPVVLDPTERILNYFRIAMATAIVIASPIVIYQIWRFIAPALFPNEKRWVLPVIPAIVLLFIAGASFGYFLVLPVSLKFLLSFGSDLISNQIRLERAVSFVVNICLVCGIVFQLPVVVFLLSKVGLISAAFLRRKRKIVILAIFILAAAITPTPDPFTMSLVAAPMWILFEISIFVASISRRKPAEV